MFCVIDNSVAYHSRQPFTGPRRILAAISQGLKAAPSQPGLVLTSGDVMPMLGYGCWKVPKEQTADMVYRAIRAGYRLID